MSNENDSGSATRRTVLGGIGAIAGTALVGGAGLAAFSGGAIAAESELNIGNTGVSNDDGDLSELVIDLDHTVNWDGFDVGVDAVSYTDEMVIRKQDGTVVGRHTLLDDYMVDFQDDFNGDGTWGNDETYQFNAVDEDDPGPGPSVLDGSISAHIVWTVLADPTAEISNDSIQTPAIIGDDVGDLDVGGDDSSVTYTVTHTKTVKFYQQGSDGDYYQLGSDDGTVAKSSASGEYNVAVTNEQKTDGSDGTGSSDAS